MEVLRDGLDALLDEIRAEAGALSRFEEIGSSDISCSVNNVLRRWYDNPRDATDTEFRMVRTGILNSLREDD